MYVVAMLCPVGFRVERKRLYVAYWHGSPYALNLGLTDSVWLVPEVNYVSR